MIRRPPRSPLFPYTPLSRSERPPEDQAVVARWAVEPADAEPRVRHGRGDPRMRTEVRRTITGVGGADVGVRTFRVARAIVDLGHEVRGARVLVFRLPAAATVPPH